MNVVGKVAVRY